MVPGNSKVSGSSDAWLLMVVGSMIQPWMLVNAIGLSISLTIRSQSLLLPQLADYQSEKVG